MGFSHTTISRVYKEWCEKGKKGENALLMLEVIYIFVYYIFLQCDLQ